jgi:MerR family transcriptional regulator, thiopeptide resistance regulator
MDANTVGAVAALTGVSVRTLHHYDHIGLVVPSVRTPAGYRGYTDADIERLHFVLVYRSVGMPLEEIRALLDDSDTDVLEHLQRQHELLLDQAERLQHTIKAVEELMNAHRDGIQLTAEEQVEIFGTTAFSEEYDVEAEERWGDTDAWMQSQQRVSRFTKQDWIAIKAEGDALLADLAQAKRGGVEPGSPEGNELAARHRESIERFYDCGDEMHRNLVEMYLADERFTRHYDDVEPGLAQFVHDIVVANINP